MSLKNCCTTDDTESNSKVQVTVNVDVPKIVKYSCLTGILIVGIIFGTKVFHKMIEEGLIKNN